MELDCFGKLLSAMVADGCCSVFGCEVVGGVIFKGRVKIASTGKLA